MYQNQCLKEIFSFKHLHKTDEYLKINELYVYFKLGKELQNKPPKVKRNI